MKKTKLLSGIALLMVCLLGVYTGRTNAYMTDYTVRSNPVTPGQNVTRITEIFPPGPPQDLGENPTYSKNVQISAPTIAGTNADCFIRARILFSNSDIGNAVALTGTGAGWVKQSDGYYYYTPRVAEGGITTSLFNTVSIRSDQIPENSKKYIKDFSITVYEESVQAGNHTSYSQAWAEFLHRQ